MFQFLIARGFRVAAAAATLCLITSVNGHASTLKVGGTGSSLGAMRILADEYQRIHPDVSIMIPESLGSSGGIKAVMAGALDIALSSRKLKPKERKAGLNIAQYAATPFILITSIRGSDPQPNLSSKDLIAAFSGESMYWKNKTPIRIILRNEHDTSTKILIKSFDGMAAALKRARASQNIPIAFTEQDNMDLAEQLPGSLTTGSLSAIVSEKRALRSVSIDGVAPTLDNLADGTYKISRSFYMITRPDLRDTALAFIRFVRSEKGAAILSKTGNLLVSPEGLPK